MTVILPSAGRDRSAKGCIADWAVKGCRMRVDNVCGPAPAGGTRRHHEADEQLSGTEAQHPSLPVPAGNGIGKIRRIPNKSDFFNKDNTYIVQFKYCSYFCKKRLI